MSDFHTHISVVHYEPGHEGIKEMVKKTADAYKKHDPNRGFYVYKPVDKASGTAYCVVTEGNFGSLSKEHGEDKASDLVDKAKEGVKSKNDFKGKVVAHSSNFRAGAPYLAVVKASYDPANAASVRQVLQEAKQHPDTSKNYTVFTVSEVPNTFYIAFGVDNIDVFDRPGGLMGHVQDQDVKDLYNKFKSSVKNIELIKLRLLPEFSNPQ